MTINEAIDWLEYQLDNLEAEKCQIDPEDYIGSDSQEARNAIFSTLHHMKNYKELKSEVSWSTNPDLMGRY